MRLVNTLKRAAADPAQAWRLMTIKPGQMPSVDVIAMRKDNDALNTLVNGVWTHTSQRDRDLMVARDNAQAEYKNDVADHYELRRTILRSSALQQDPRVPVDYKHGELREQQLLETAEWHRRGVEYTQVYALGRKRPMLYPYHNGIMETVTKRLISLRIDTSAEEIAQGYMVELEQRATLAAPANTSPAPAQPPVVSGARKPQLA